MKIGITGTRSGLCETQFNNIQTFLIKNFIRGAELHHGDCVGADVEVATLAQILGYVIVCHPPIKKALRANFPSDITHEPRSYFERNRIIVDSVDHLMVAPKEHQPQSQGGTWYTYHYAVKKQRPLSIFYPVDHTDLI